MAAFQLQRVQGAILAFVGTVTFAGCAVSGRSMQMDSTSKMPWFNLELRQSKPKSDTVPFREVRSNRKKESRVEALGLSRSSAADAKIAANQATPSKTALPINESRQDAERVGSFEEASYDFH